MPALVSRARSLGYAVFFITGRPDAQHADTVANLQGHELDGESYPVTTTGSLSPQGDNLFTKRADPATPALSQLQRRRRAGLLDRRVQVWDAGLHRVAGL
jgi:hypothetical protein